MLASHANPGGGTKSNRREGFRDKKWQETNSELQSPNFQLPPTKEVTVSKINRFEELNAWQTARELTKRVYSASKGSALAKDYGLRDQLQRASVSIMSNVAEGFERVNRPEKLQFLNIARASCGEVRSLTYVCEDNGCMERGIAEELRELCNCAGRLITGLMKSLKEE